MTRRRWSALALTLAAALALPAGSAAEAPSTPTPGGDGSAAEKYFTNTELVDQDGIPRKFYRDLLQKRKVLINFAFTSCSGVCPVMTANLARVQKLLGGRVGKEITMMTITVDPVNDTPAVLKAFAAKHKAGPGWYFLSGTPANVNAVLKRIGGAVARPSDHSATLLIGDTSTGMWVKSLATERPETIVYLVDHLNDKK